jgi:UDP-GlcNAc:undecaprenyl-phosphate GlcNAc-1-phosphate transferase
LSTPVQLTILPFVIAFTATFLLVPQVRRFAIEWRLGDKPNGRKLHAHAIPHLGGIAIFGGFFLALLISLGTGPGVEIAARVLALLPGLIILFGLGLIDDLRGLRASLKLIYQLLGASCVVAMGASLQAGSLSDPAFVAVLALSVLWYVAVTNSVNLIDGLDGLAAGTSVISSMAFLFVGWRIGEPAVVLVAVSLMGGLLAFLRFNFHPARIFMGDTGSMFIGFTLAFLACLLVPRVGLWTALLGSAAIVGVPVMDTTTAIVRRLLARQHIFQADGQHTHHKLMRCGLSHRGTVVVLYALSAGFAAMGAAILMGQLVWFIGAVALGLVASMSIAVLARRRAAVPATPELQPAPVLASPVPLATASVLSDPVEMPARATAPVVPVHELRGVAEDDSPVVADIRPRVGRS